MAKVRLEVKGMSCQHCVKTVTDALTTLDGVQHVKVNLRKGEAVVRYDASYITDANLAKVITEVGFEAVTKTEPLSLSLIGGILITLFSIIGCSDMPYTGSMLTAEDVDRYITIGEDSACLLSGHASACITLIPETEDDSRPVIHIHPRKLIYVFYYEGVQIMRAERVMDTTEIMEQVRGPEEDDQQPDDSTEDGGTGGDVDGDGGGTPGGGGGTPGDGGGTPGDGGTQQPDGGTQQPDGGTQQPDGGTQQPDGGTQQPDGGTQQPDGGTQQPDGGTQQPDGGTQQPDGGTQQPDGGGNNVVGDPDIQSHYYYDTKNPIAGDGWLIWIYYPAGYNVPPGFGEGTGVPAGFTLTPSHGEKTQGAQTSAPCSDYDNDEEYDNPCTDGSDYSAQFRIRTNQTTITVTVRWDSPYSYLNDTYTLNAAVNIAQNYRNHTSQRN